MYKFKTKLYVQRMRTGSIVKAVAKYYTASNLYSTRGYNVIVLQYYIPNSALKIEPQNGPPFEIAL